MSKNLNLEREREKRPVTKESESDIFCVKTVTKEVERERNGGCLVVIVNKNERDRG